MGQNNGHPTQTRDAHDGGDAAGTVQETIARSTSLFSFPTPAEKEHQQINYQPASQLLLKEAAKTSNTSTGIVAPRLRHRSADPVMVGKGGRDSSLQARKRARLFATTSAHESAPDLRSVWYLLNRPDQEQRIEPCVIPPLLDDIAGCGGGAAAAAADMDAEDAGGGGEVTTDEEQPSASANVIITLPPPTTAPETTATAIATGIPAPPIPASTTAASTTATSTTTPTAATTTTTTTAATACNKSKRATTRKVPLVERLSHKLVHTYQGINTKYYAAIASKDSTSAASATASGGGGGTKKRKKVPHNSQQTDGRYVVVKGEILGGRYAVESKLGSGTFGTVVAAWDTVKNVSVAVKVVRKQAAFLRQAKIEAQLLRELRQKAPNYTFDLIHEFEWDEHTCFVFERAQMNLYELVQMSSYRGVGLEMVSSIGKQLVRALDRFAQPDLNLIHADLKPENIMFTTDVTISSSSDTTSMFGSAADGSAASGATLASADTDDEPAAAAAAASLIASSQPPAQLPEVRLIDFGSSCTVDQNMYKYIQSRYYRAPEVVLELPYDTKIDVWSLGCVLYELYTGDPLFRTKDAVDHIYQIENVCGKVPRAMLANTKRTDLFEAETGNPVDRKAAARAARKAKGPLPFLFAARAVGGQGYGDDGAAENDFLDLLQCMLMIDPAVRASPQELLKHPFFGGGGVRSGIAPAHTVAEIQAKALFELKDSERLGRMIDALTAMDKRNLEDGTTVSTKDAATATAGGGGGGGGGGGAVVAAATAPMPQTMPLSTTLATTATAATMAAAMSTTPPTTAVTAAAASAAAIATPFKSKTAAMGVGEIGCINAAAGFDGGSGISSLVAAAARLQQSFSG